MALSANDLRTKYQIVPGQVSVTFKANNAGGGSSIAGARKRPLSKEERAYAEMSIGMDACMWILPANTLGATVPKPGDSVTDSASAVWLIQGVTSGLMEAEYKCLCVKAR